MALRDRETETFVSHGSLGREERRRSEAAFAEAGNCVIVATSTLELGIDVGDLDRVIQIDSPPTVAGFLQRIGRTGRRPGASRNALFLTTSTDALLGAAGLLRLWASGYVEPAEPPAFPVHLLAQQLLALTLQEADAGLGAAGWLDWLGDPPVFGPELVEQAPALMRHLLADGWVHSDQGVLSPGPRAEQTIGKRHFLELTSVFVADPLVSIRQGRTEIGQVPDIAITAATTSRPGPPTILLAGRAWQLGEIDWKRRVAQVEPVDHKGKVRFHGSAQPLSYQLCQAMAGVLAGEALDPVTLTTRATGALEDLRGELHGAEPGRTLLVDTDRGRRWYTFAGMRANLELAARLSPLRSAITQRENLYITVDHQVDRSALQAAIAGETPTGELQQLVADISGALKLQRVLPEQLVADILVRRLTDLDAIHATTRAPIDQVHR